MLLRTRVFKFLCEHASSFPVGLHLAMTLLGHRASVVRARGAVRLSPSAAQFYRPSAYECSNSSTSLTLNNFFDYSPNRLCHTVHIMAFTTLCYTRMYEHVLTHEKLECCPSDNFNPETSWALILVFLIHEWSTQQQLTHPAFCTSAWHAMAHELNPASCPFFFPSK